MSTKQSTAVRKRGRPVNPHNGFNTVLSKVKANPGISLAQLANRVKGKNLSESTLKMYLWSAQRVVEAINAVTKPKARKPASKPAPAPAEAAAVAA